METLLSIDHSCNTIPVHAAVNVRVWRGHVFTLPWRVWEALLDMNVDCLEGVCVCLWHGCLVRAR